jgi:hypothetical protein
MPGLATRRERIVPHLNAPRARSRVGDYAESHSGLPPQSVLDAPGEGGGAHSGLPPQTVFGAFAKSIPKSPNYYAKIAVFCGGLTNA